MKKNMVILLLVLTMAIMTGCLPVTLVKVRIYSDVVGNLAMADTHFIEGILETAIGKALNDPANHFTPHDPQFAHSAHFERENVKMEHPDYDQITIHHGLQTATVKVPTTAPGTVILYDEQGRYLTTKDATLTGFYIVEAAHIDGGWETVRRVVELATTASTVTISEPVIEPRPVAVGESFTLQTQIQAAGEIRGMAGLQDEMPLLEYVDGYYKTSQPITVHEKTYSVGVPAIIKAVDWDSVRDLSRQQGEVPVQMSIQAFFVPVE